MSVCSPENLPRQSLPLRLPKPLQKGDTIAVIAPAGQLHNEDAFYKGAALLQEMGFSLQFPRGLWPGDGGGYLADSDCARSEEFNRIWAGDAAAIIALRGGFGSLRMADGIDFELVRRKPKLLIGFSDITILLNLIYQRAGVVSLHAPVLTSLGTSTPEALERLYQCLTTPLANYPPISAKNIEILRSSGAIAAEKAENAPLIGGNLATLTTLLGTEWDFDYKGGFLLLEDIGEPLYKIDRMLTQLLLAGKFAGIAGVLIGDFHTAEEHPQNAPLRHLRYIETVWTRVLECLDSAGNDCPVYGRFPAGHIRENLAAAIGLPLRSTPGLF